MKRFWALLYHSIKVVSRGGLGRDGRVVKFHMLWLDTAGDKTVFGSQLNESESQLGPE